MTRREQKAKVKNSAKKVTKAFYEMLDQMNHYVDHYDETEADEFMQDLLNEATTMYDEFQTFRSEL